MTFSLRKKKRESQKGYWRKSRKILNLMLDQDVYVVR